ncbi:hypothetical protein CPTAKMNP4_006 [Salmonella phage vB_SenM-AKM_NP4]|uniref:Uncharacterized protein n=4 Tax=Gelderlandvirus TaxID=1913653 RepID=M1GU52_BPS16|nr:hypothetical protein I133_gp266 [Salmonella phage vB_SenM-S16]YP_009147998.1 hypothetical protein ACQ31_gp073 [Salmonella phage STML-198]YP_009286370.1 hypothetical protein BI049_gp004 [Salmonella phage vB_SnwM_CGG4-1]YP_009615490.1 hypothetical protein FDI73_gp004 [Salmonella phage Melville]UPW42378.1 hypothetical protein EBPHNEJP_00080 [Salmonella phage CF-SP2]WDR21672.1 hypothetical protein PJM34_0004 [Salmonella phage vB_SenM_UTK0003]WKV23352.1 hypothetical protein SEA1_gp0004 [Salmone
MSQIWVTLVDGSFGYMWGDALPLPGDMATIRVRQPDNSLKKVTGMVSKATW